MDDHRHAADLGERLVGQAGGAQARRDQHHGRLGRHRLDDHRQIGQACSRARARRHGLGGVRWDRLPRRRVRRLAVVASAAPSGCGAGRPSVIISTELACHGSLARNQQGLGRTPHGRDHRLGLRGDLAHPLPSSMPEENAYVIEVPEAETERGEAATRPRRRRCPCCSPPASPEKGATEAKKCAACHSEEKGGPIKIGPPLWGVVGRDIASVEGFEYSEALREQGRAVDLRQPVPVHPWPQRLGARHQDGVRRHQGPRGPGRSPGLSAHARRRARAAAGGATAEAAEGAQQAGNRPRRRPSQPVQPGRGRAGD